MVPVLPDPEIWNLEGLRKKGFWMSASACALPLPSIVVQLFETHKKSEKYNVNCFRKAEWSGKVLRKIPRVSNRSKKLRASRRGRECQGSVPGCQVSGGLKKCMGASEWCRGAQNVRKGVKFRNQESAEKL